MSRIGRILSITVEHVTDHEQLGPQGVLERVIVVPGGKNLVVARKRVAAADDVGAFGRAARQGDLVRARSNERGESGPHPLPLLGRAETSAAERRQTDVAQVRDLRIKYCLRRWIIDTRDQVGRLGLHHESGGDPVPESSFSASCSGERAANFGCARAVRATAAAIVMMAADARKVRRDT